MGYNVLSGSTSVINVIQSGSFTGDGSGLENVEQFELIGAAASYLPFYKLVSGELALESTASFSFSTSNKALTVPGLTSSVGIRLLSPTSGTIAGEGSYLGIDANGSIVITSSAGIDYGRRAVTSTATASINNVLIGISASAALELRLPSASDYKIGQYFTIKDEGGNANLHNITIKTSGSQTIDGQTSIVLESPFSSVNLYSNGVDKFFIY
tara:strand:- start:299 stop:934 length:636 start_codon:yes stop_codon:yes gene_type:complete